MSRFGRGVLSSHISTAVSSEAWAKLREWAILASKGRLLLSGSVVLASLKAAVFAQTHLALVATHGCIRGVSVVAFQAELAVIPCGEVTTSVTIPHSAGVASLVEFNLM